MKRRVSLIFIPICIIMLILTAVGWMLVPEGALIPIHWGIDGQPDGFSAKPFALVFIPVVALVVYIIFVGIPLIEPRQENLALSIKFYTTIATGIFGILLLTQAIIVFQALGYSFDVFVLYFVSLGILMVSMGNLMGKLRSTFFTGIRTPWTLASEQVWNKTHRFSGRLFMVLGLLMIFGALFNINRWLLVGIFAAGIVGLALFGYIYSFIIWKQETKPS